ncbi:MAG: PQQ-binding-like beta-propeller repeat protein [Acidobacteria bacterium]|nr:PQQ-binding-like beta-propeller repeat protein [Acidobacteriota bacterium]NIM63457.1 PQQ-binding-like beta-propeller repeat protein [Acidobacteriota bacterium]NIO60885.1 PQQ-binding-like beta-propeller repeat protein [Acidobacteriota bacterium]NIQ31077.1 PQQ-binding-like beta-propeller repeat protein [Acidobacteriota bacterium]NIQ87346.1 PQQ-binding-like beta-propeller repeat protein [Acidobacteriota bacterium]
MIRPRFVITLLLIGLLVPTAGLPADWPQFRGPQRDGTSSETGLLRSWPDGGPEVLWSTPVGQGYSSAAIHDGRVYFNDYDESTFEFLVRALNLEDGKELWRFKEKRRIRPNHGITRAVPATDGKVVIALDPKAVLHALDAETGKEIWRKNFVQDYESKIPPWYNGQNPLIEDDKVVVAPAGPEALVVALDKATGEELWRTPNPEGWLLSHASLMPAKLGGVDQYLFSVLQGTVGVSAADGKLLWHFPFKFNVSVSPSPLAIDSERVYVTAAYDSGGAMFRVKRDGDDFSTEEIFVHAADEWNSEVQTPILFEDHMFAVGKKRRGLFTCLDLDGKQVWNSDGHAYFGLGSFILADGMFFILEGKTGMLRLLEANTKEYKQLASAQLLEGHDVWGPPALSDGILVIRDFGKMIGVSLRKGG